MTEVFLSLVIGVLYATGLYLMMCRNIAKFIIGLGLLGHGANLLIFTAAGLSTQRAPIVPQGLTIPLAPIVDPLPQALILTAIVIGFGLTAFVLALFLSAHDVEGTDDLDKLRSTDQ